MQAVQAGPVRTQNFVIYAPASVAQQVGQYAERYRKEKALAWLGREMPDWSQPCPLTVKVGVGNGSGWTSFAFDRGRVIGQRMQVEGSYERILDSVLPHEITHTVLAYQFGRPVPRWADEGAACQEEAPVAQDMYARELQQRIASKRTIPLRRLFALTEYPDDVMALYGQGHSVTAYLVSLKGKPTFTAFLYDGTYKGWDQALQKWYGIRSIEALEQTWTAHCWPRLGQPRQPQPYVPQPMPQPMPYIPPPASADQGLLDRIRDRLDVLPGLIGAIQDRIGEPAPLAPDDEQRLQRIEKGVGLLGTLLPILTGGAVTGGIAVPVLMAGTWLYRRFRGGQAPPTATVAPEPPTATAARTSMPAVIEKQIIRENPPPPQVIRDESKYVPVEVLSPELRALKEAMDEVAKKYPGQVSTIEMIKAYAAQIASGQRKE